MKKKFEDMSQTQLLTNALILALTAPTDALAKEAVASAARLTRGLTQAEIEACQRSAATYVNR